MKSYKNKGPVPLEYFGVLGSGFLYEGAQGQANHFGVLAHGFKTYGQNPGIYIDIDIGVDIDIDTGIDIT